MVYQSIYIPLKTLEDIDEEVKKIGYNLSRSAWVVQACKEKLTSDRKNIDVIIKKLRKWHTSFPKKPFKEILEELSNGEIQHN